MQTPTRCEKQTLSTSSIKDPNHSLFGNGSDFLIKMLEKFKICADLRNLKNLRTLKVPNSTCFDLPYRL